MDGPSSSHPPNTPRYTGHDWRWICSVLASRRFSPPRLPLVDTVIIERGRPTIWLSLDEEGQVVPRAVTDAQSREIYNTFTSLSLGYVRNTSAQRACVAHYSVGLPQVIDKGTFATHITVGFLVATAIQPYVASQGCSRLPTNLRYEYAGTQDPSLRDPALMVLGRNAPRVPVFQYAETPQPLQPGQPSFRMVPASLAQPQIPQDVIERMERVTLQLVYYLHRACPTERVVKLVAEYSLDDNGQLWLVYCPDVRTEPNPLLALPDVDDTGAVAPASSPSNRPHVTLPDGSVHPIHRVGIPEVPPVGIKDLIDLRNSPHPHPSLQAVGSLLAQCITGLAKPWARASNALRGSGADEFLLRMRALERSPQFLDIAKLEEMRPVVSSEMFSPDALRRIGLLGEKLGLWVLAVTQGALEYHGCPGYFDLPLLFRVNDESRRAAQARGYLLQVGAIMVNQHAPTQASLAAASASADQRARPAGSGAAAVRAAVAAASSSSAAVLASATAGQRAKLLSNPLAQPLTAKSKAKEGAARRASGLGWQVAPGGMGPGGEGGEPASRWAASTQEGAGPAAAAARAGTPGGAGGLDFARLRVDTGAGAGAGRGGMGGALSAPSASGSVPAERDGSAPLSSAPASSGPAGGGTMPSSFAQQQAGAVASPTAARGRGSMVAGGGGGARGKAVRTTPSPAPPAQAQYPASSTAAAAAPASPPGPPGVTESGQFVLADGVTTIQFAILGSREAAGPTRTSLVVVGDLFDTWEYTAQSLRPLLGAKGQGCHVLLFNFPGQAGTRWANPPAEESPVAAAVAAFEADVAAGTHGASGVVGGLHPGSATHNGEGPSAFLAEPPVVPTSAIAGPLLPPRLALTSIISTGLESGARGASSLGTAAPGGGPPVSPDGVHFPDPETGGYSGPPLDEHGLPILPLQTGNNAGAAELVDGPSAAYAVEPHSNELELPGSRAGSRAGSRSGSPLAAAAAGGASSGWAGRDSDRGAAGGAGGSSGPSGFRAVVGSQMAPANPSVLNNEFLASALHQLLLYLDGMRLFLTSSAPYAWDVVGLGVGASAALTWATRYARSFLRRPERDVYIPRDRAGRLTAAAPRGLRSLVCMNGWGHVDPQLKTILDSTKAVLGAFPPDRVDLPTAFFSRFLFSDRYLSVVPRDVAISVYNAAAPNPITLEGRVRLVQGVLSGTDIRAALSALPLPLVLVASADDSLVAPINARALASTRGAWMEVDADAQRDPIVVDKPYIGMAEPSTTGWQPPEGLEMDRTGLGGEGDGGGRPLSASAIAASPKRPTAVSLAAQLAGVAEDEMIAHEEGGASASASASAAQPPKPAAGGPLKPGEPIPPELLFFNTPLSAEAVLRLAQAVTSAEAAETLVLHVKAGHELRQERPATFADILRVLTDTSAAAVAAAADLEDGDEGGGGGGGQGGPPSRGRPGQSRGSGGGGSGGGAGQGPTGGGPGYGGDGGPSDENHNGRQGSSHGRRRAGGARDAEGGKRGEDDDEEDEEEGKVGHSGDDDDDDQEESKGERRSRSRSVSPRRLASPSRAEAHTQLLRAIDVLPPRRLVRAPVSSTTGIVSLSRPVSAEPGHRVSMSARSSGLDHHVHHRRSHSPSASRASAAAAAAAALFEALPEVPSALVGGSLLFVHNAAPPPLPVDLEAMQAEEAKRRHADVSFRKEASAAVESRLLAAQEERRQRWAKEDAALLKGIFNETAARRDQREKELKVATQEAEARHALFQLKQARFWAEATRTGGDGPVPIPTLPLGPLRKDNLEFGLQVLRDAENGGGVSTVETVSHVTQREFEAISDIPFAILRRQAEEAAIEEERLRREAARQLRLLQEGCAIQLQAWTRGVLARQQCRRLRLMKYLYSRQQKAVLKIQRLVRSRRGTLGAMRLRREQALAWKFHNAAIDFQRVIRGHLARRTAEGMRADRAALTMQRVWRGFRDRMIVRLLRAAKEGLDFYAKAATSIQAVWRMYVLRTDFKELCIVRLAAVQVQRWYRGFKQRREYARLRELAALEPGPEKVELGFKHMITIKDVFTRSRDVVDKLQRGLYRAENDLASAKSAVRAAEGKVALIDTRLAELKAAEGELKGLISKVTGVEDVLTGKSAPVAAAAAATGKGGSKPATAAATTTTGKPPVAPHGLPAAASKSVSFAGTAGASPAPGAPRGAPGASSSSRTLPPLATTAASPSSASAKQPAAPTKPLPPPTSKPSPTSGEAGVGPKSRFDGEAIRRAAVGLGGLPGGLAAIVRSQDMLLGRTPSQAAKDLASVKAEVDYEVEVAVRAAYARKGKLHAELQSERERTVAELAGWKAKADALFTTVRDIRAALKRNSRGFNTIKDNVDAVAKEQLVQMELARPKPPPPMPSYAMISELDRRVRVVQSISDHNTAVASDTAAQVHSFVSKALPSFVGAMGMVGAFRNMNARALADDPRVGGPEAAAALLGPLAPRGLLGSGLVVNTRMDFHHLVHGSLEAQLAGEAQVLRLEDGTMGRTAGGKGGGGGGSGGGGGGDGGGGDGDDGELGYAGGRDGDDDDDDDDDNDAFSSRPGTTVRPARPAATGGAMSMLSGSGKGGASSMWKRGGAGGKGKGGGGSSGGGADLFSAMRARKSPPPRRPKRGAEELMRRLDGTAKTSSSSAAARGGVGVGGGGGGGTGSLPQHGLSATGGSSLASATLRGTIPAGAMRQSGVAGGGSSSSSRTRGTLSPERLLKVDPAVEPLGLTLAATGQPVHRRTHKSAGVLSGLELIKLVAEGGGVSADAEREEEAESARALEDVEREEGVEGVEEGEGGGAPSSSSSSRPSASHARGGRRASKTSTPSRGGGTGKASVSSAQTRTRGGGRRGSATAPVDGTARVGADAAGADVEADEEAEAQGAFETRRLADLQAAKEAARHRFPRKLRDWKRRDVGRWLVTLTLSEHVSAFETAGVDGEFLINLQPKDVRDVLGVEDRTHLGMLMHAREELRRADFRNDCNLAINGDPAALAAVAGLKGAAAAALATVEGYKVPPFAAVMAEACAGKLRQVERALRAGLDPDTSDASGHTLLMAAARHGHRRLVDLLITRGADVNKANARGNTALHFVSDRVLRTHVDPDGSLAAYLLSRGADKQKRNALNFRAVEGLGEADAPAAQRERASRALNPTGAGVADEKTTTAGGGSPGASPGGAASSSSSSSPSAAAAVAAPTRSLRPNLLRSGGRKRVEGVAASAVALDGSNSAWSIPGVGSGGVGGTLTGVFDAAEAPDAASAAAASAAAGPLPSATAPGVEEEAWRQYGYASAEDYAAQWAAYAQYYAEQQAGAGYYDVGAAGAGAGAGAGGEAGADAASQGQAHGGGEFSLQSPSFDERGAAAPDRNGTDGGAFTLPLVRVA
jgi:hypothetical protein